MVVPSYKHHQLIHFSISPSFVYAEVGNRTKFQLSIIYTSMYKYWILSWVFHTSVQQNTCVSRKFILIMVLASENDNPSFPILHMLINGHNLWRRCCSSISNGIAVIISKQSERKWGNDRIKWRWTYFINMDHLIFTFLQYDTRFWFNVKYDGNTIGKPSNQSLNKTIKMQSLDILMTTILHHFLLIKR